MSPLKTVGASELVSYWQAAGARKWFGKDPRFDKEFRVRFLLLHEDAAARRLEAWMESAYGALGLLLLLDQFPRNAFRGSPRMYTTDSLAHHYADLAVRARFDDAVSADLRLFFYLPFAHSEQLEDQDRSVALHKRLGYTANAERHRDIIRRFGRFPHRNPILGREMTAAEREFLDSGGYSG